MSMIDDLPGRQVLARAAMDPADLCSIPTPLLRQDGALLCVGTPLARALAAPL